MEISLIELATLLIPSVLPHSIAFDAVQLSQTNIPDFGRK